MIDGGLRKLFHSRLGGHWQAVETGSTGRGVPDSNYCILGAEGWIEFKKCKHWRVGIWPEQIAWIEKRARYGGRVFIAVRRAEDELWLLAASAARYLKDPGLKGVPEEFILAKFEGGPSGWDWEKIEKILQCDVKDYEWVSQAKKRRTNKGNV